MTDYGAYDDDRREEPRRYKSSRTRARGRDDPDYIEETTYVEKGKGAPPRDLVYRPRDREDSIEDIPREFPPPSRGARSYRDDDYDDPPPRRRRARSAAGRSGYDDDYDDYGPSAAGAASGYAMTKRRSGRERDQGDRRRERDGYYSDEYERYDRYSDSGSRDRGKDRRKSGIESTLEGLGLGGVVGALTGKSKSKSRAGSRESSRSRSRGPKEGRSERQWAQAAQAALVAGAVEAFRARNEPGGWGGAKGKRVATAAIGAGGIDKLVTGKGDPENKSKRHLVEAVLGGLAANRLANGPVDKTGESRGRSGSRSRSRSRSRSVFDRFRSKSRGRSRSSSGSRDGGRSRSKGGGVGLEKIAAGGALAAGAKAIYDRVRSKSRGAKDRRRSPSNSSEDSYVPSRSRRRDVGSSRGLDGEGYGPDDRAVSGRGAAAGAGAGAGASTAALNKGPHGQSTGGGKDESDDTESSSALEDKRKKMRGKELLTAGLATVATIHAAHGVYQSMEGSEKRHKLVQEGEMSPEQARKQRSKAWLQDAAAVGIAALGIKGAYSEWKEMNERRHNVKELEERRRARQKRLAQRRKEQSSGRGGGGGGGGRGDYGPPPPRDSGRLPAPVGGHGHYDYDDEAPTGYQDGNPYGSSHLPPPPMGASNGGYR
ncbi:MAG: hypothetical protein M1828_004448 [Chrysothrix sp. TS-e1954]|nr:MAG: hypothetical protein M1828_004448 [Chrysothrix sp. TS-e1954]